MSIWGSGSMTGDDADFTLPSLGRLPQIPSGQDGGGFDLGGLSGFLGPIGALGSAILGRNAAKSANDQNRLTALYQMNWQERMSNTAHQREVADLKAAGLNPILSATRGGASTPQGAGYTAQPTYKAEFAQIMAAAQQVAAQTELLKAETRKTNVEADNLALQPALIGAQTEAQLGSAEHARATAASVRQEMESFVPRMARLKEEINNLNIEGGILTEEKKMRARKLQAEVAQTLSSASHLNQQAYRLKLEAPAAYNQMMYDLTEYGQKVRPLLGDVGKVVAPVTSAVGAYAGARVASRPPRPPAVINKTYNIRK